MPSPSPDPPSPRRRLSSVGLMKGRLAAVARGVMQVHTMTNIARSLGTGTGPSQPRSSSRRGSVDSTRSRRSSGGGRKEGRRTPKR
ncbi:Hypp236 [Branchiostoma lanceolatum]|uniref:Hypp236 protein n=1 Tax=Branchiostoma lanceolatum TaxID=7740 RepID=A0A8J9W2R8_BRALA|nr:Hypp236 [Branchiostoma lanceolatum]